MGLEGLGADYLSAILQDEQFELTAVADTKPELLRRHTEGTNVRTYEDYRSLVVEAAPTGLDLLFVALEPFQSIEFVQLAARHGIGVFHKAPFARNIAEARKLVQQFATRGCPLVVARPWRLEPSFTRLREIGSMIGRIYAVSADVRTTDDSTGWRGDAARAGGGVLLNGAYAHVDLLVQVLGLPDMVYAQCGMAVAPRSARNYDTEDAAMLSLRFSDGRIATLAAWRRAARASWQVSLIGADGVMELFPDRATIAAGDTGSLESYDVPAGDTITKQISEFGRAHARAVENARSVDHARAVENPLSTPTREPSSDSRSSAPVGRSGATRIPSTAEEHLPVLAVIEAAYLSSKTGAPEPPGQFLSTLSS